MEEENARMEKLLRMGEVRVEEARIAAEATPKIREERKDNDDTKKAARSWHSLCLQRSRLCNHLAF